MENQPENQNLNAPQASVQEPVIETNIPFWKNKSLLVGLLVFLLVPLTLFGVYKLGQNSQKQTTVVSAPTPTPVDETAGWNVYNDSELGVTFKYPTDVTLKEHPEDVTTITLTLVGPTQKEQTEFYDGVSIAISRQKLNGLSVRQVAQDLIAMSEKNGTGEVIEPISETKVGDKTGVTYRVRGLGEFTYIFIPKDEETYIFISDGTNDPTGKGYIDLSKKIISNFKFTDSSDESQTDTVINAFYKEWLSLDGPPSAKADTMLQKGYITERAATSIKSATGIDLPTCSQNPLSFNMYKFSKAQLVIEPQNEQTQMPTAASVDIEANYQQSIEKFSVILAPLANSWKINAFQCPN